MLKRRQFLSGLASLGILGSSEWAKASAAEPRGMSGKVSLQGELSKDVFLALVLERFSVLIANRSVTIVLLKVDDDDFHPQTEQFTVLFRGARNLKLEEGAYTTTHRTAGTTRLYFRPAGHDGYYTYYEAPFNLLQ